LIIAAFIYSTNIFFITFMWYKLKILHIYNFAFGFLIQMV